MAARPAAMTATHGSDRTVVRPVIVQNLGLIRNIDLGPNLVIAELEWVQMFLNKFNVFHDNHYYARTA